MKIQDQKRLTAVDRSFLFVQSRLEPMQIIHTSFSSNKKKRNPNGQYMQGINGECAADLVINADPDTDKLIQNVNRIVVIDILEHKSVIIHAVCSGRHGP